MVAYLCNFLDEKDEKPWKVLKAAGLTPKTAADWHTPDAVNVLYTAAQRHMPPALDDSEEAEPLTRSLRILTLMLIKFSFFLYLFFLWEAYRDCFHDFSFSLRFLEVSHVEASSRERALLGTIQFYYKFPLNSARGVNSFSSLSLFLSLSGTGTRKRRYWMSLNCVPKASLEQLMSIN